MSPGDFDTVSGLLSRLVQLVERIDHDQNEFDRIASTLSLDGLSQTARKKAIKKEQRRLIYLSQRKEERIKRNKRSREKKNEFWDHRRELIEQGKRNLS